MPKRHSEDDLRSLPDHRPDLTYPAKFGRPAFYAGQAVSAHLRLEILSQHEQSVETFAVIGDIQREHVAEHRKIGRDLCAFGILDRVVDGFLKDREDLTT